MMLSVAKHTRKSMANINTELLDILCEEMPFSRAEAQLLIYSASQRYKIHFIEKRNGRGKRLIAQPTAEVKVVQRWAIDKYIKQLPIHDAAKAYRHRISIKNHASAHAKNKYLLKVDFKDFFPSIKADDFIAHMCRNLQVSVELASDLARLLFRHDKQAGLILSIGAPSSPAVSNTLMFEFDSRLHDFCVAHDVSYTRYADDLALSTNTPHVLDDVFKYIQSLIKEIAYPKLTINPAKTTNTSKKFQRQLTGLILTNDGQVSLGREKKRMIRAMANNYLHGKLPPLLHSRLKGFLAFAHSIEPAFVLKIRKAMGEEQYIKLLKGE